MHSECEQRESSVCPRCGTQFSCAVACAKEQAVDCWCAALPKIVPVDGATACLCPSCLAVEIERRQERP